MGRIHLSDKQWALIRPFLPPPARTGRPRANDRRTIEGILYILITGCRWQDLPREYGAPTTVWRRLKRWGEGGIWDLHSARSVGRFVELFVRGSEEREHLLVEGLQAEHHLHGWVGSLPDVEEVHAFKALEDPAHRRAVGRFLDLAGDRLSGGGELLTEPMLGQAVHQETEHHHQAEGDDAARLLDEDGRGQKQRILEEGESPFHAALIFVRLTHIPHVPLLNFWDSWHRRPPESHGTIGQVLGNAGRASTRRRC
jgi:transposase